MCQTIEFQIVIAALVAGMAIGAIGVAVCWFNATEGENRQ